MGVDRGADDAVNTIGRGRLDRKLAASGLQKRGKLIRNGPDGCHLTTQPTFEQRRIGDARLAKAGQGADFGTVPFSGPPRQDRRKAGGAATASWRASSSTTDGSISPTVRGNRPRSRKNASSTAKPSRLP
jgi:hypothetical protein